MASLVVVDDAVELLEGLEQLLSMDGHEVRTATCGHEAAELLREEQPDALLSDIEMPGMDGMALARWVRETYDHEICLVALTGATDRLDEAREVFDLALPKPVAYERLSSFLLTQRR